MTTRVFVGGISYNVTDAQLAEHFAKVGTVVSAKIITDRNSGQSKGFGFVEMSSDDEANLAMKELNNTDLAGRTIVVKEALPQVQRARTDRNDR